MAAKPENCSARSLPAKLEDSPTATHAKRRVCSANTNTAVTCGWANCRLLSVSSLTGGSSPVLLQNARSQDSTLEITDGTYKS